MTLKKQTIWAREHLIDLMDQSDIDALWSRWNLTQDAEKDRTSVEFIGAISGLSTLTRAGNPILKDEYVADDQGCDRVPFSSMLQPQNNRKHHSAR
jgi:hypothetical protein